MKTAPLKVLLLGWDAPAASADAVLLTPALLETLAPQIGLTLLLPHLSEPVQLAALMQTTGLGNLTANDLALLNASYETDRSQTWQWPASPYLGATPGLETEDIQEPAAPYAGRAEAPAATAAPTAVASDFTAGPETHDGSVGISEAADLGAGEAELPSTFYAEPAADPAEFNSQETQPNAPAEPTPTPAAPRVELPVRHSILDVALAALQALPTDEASLNFRVIQYARLATRLASSQEFSVIYAADWQSWLAGMEIRQLTGKPLVLHVHSLAQERNTPVDRGWVTELERMALRRASLVLTATPALAQRVVELHELAPECVRQATTNDPDLLAETILSVLQEVSSS